MKTSALWVPLIALWPAWGQLPGAAPARTSTAVQLPLSGRGQAGSVTVTQQPVPGTTTSVNTINPALQVQGPYTGSTPGAGPFTGRLSLRDAIARGLQYNLGAVGLAQAVRQARGQARTVRSALLPNVNGNLSETVEQTNLAAFGLRFRSPFPGLSIPTVAGPFNFFDLRASLTQAVADLTAWHNYRSASEVARANQLSAQDARDLVVLGIGGAYLQAIAAEARIASAQAQLDTANALYRQAADRRAAGLATQIDVNRARVQAQTQQQRLISLRNDLAKLKISLARMTGLPPNDGYEIADQVPYAPAPALKVEDAIGQAFRERRDLQAAAAQLRAAQQAAAAARAERLPSVSLSADYGAIGINPGQAHGTFSVVGTVRVPIWQGGRVAGDIEQAEAARDQRRAELADLKGRVEADVRNAYLDLEAAASQVQVARQNLDVTRENLKLTRQRFEAGVSDNVEVVQSQEAVANAELDYINSIFAHNVAKLSLARAEGQAAENWGKFLAVR